MASNEVRTASAYCGDLILDLRATCMKLQGMDGAEFEAVAGYTDRHLGQFYRRIEACRRFMELHRTATVEPFAFGEAFRRWNPSSGGILAGLRGNDPFTVVGDSRQILACLELITMNIQTSTVRSFEIRVHADTKPPSLLVTMNGAPPFGHRLSFGGGLDVTWETLANRWADATDGGLLYEDDPGIVLDLSGREVGTLGVSSFEPAELCLRRAERAMMPWRGTIGNTETGYADPEEAPRLYATHLERATAHLEEAVAIVSA